VQIVVVTRLPGSLNINDGVFHQQIGNMMMARHQNVVQFLGYCSCAVEKKVEIGGDVVIAEKRERLLCFEYLSKGNLSKHLSGMII
jgi:coatomer subunit beta'